MVGSAFWNFSLSVYGTHGVPDACIALQDSSGVDVNVMLYLLWLAGERRQLSQSDVDKVVKDIDAWRTAVVVPVRTARRALKEPPPLLKTDHTEMLRNKVKAVELEAERLQQEALYSRGAPSDFGAEVSDVRAAATENLACYAKALNTNFDPDSLSTVISAAVEKAG